MRELTKREKILVIIMEIIIWLLAGLLIITNMR